MYPIFGCIDSSAVVDVVVFSSNGFHGSITKFRASKSKEVRDKPPFKSVAHLHRNKSTFFQFTTEFLGCLELLAIIQDHGNVSK